jgi:site-specific DNA-methyltransferase (adenine-specific)
MWNTGAMAKNVYGDYAGEVVGSSKLGRWPANIIHDGSEEVMEAFAVFGDKGGGFGTENRKDGTGIYGRFSGLTAGTTIGFGDTGTAARFYYAAKASKAERNGSKHPTIKPVSLMRYLCKLVTPPGGTVLDPFAGTGTTGQAAVDEGFSAILIEQESEYCTTIRCRLALWLTPSDEAHLDNTCDP